MTDEVAEQKASHIPTFRTIEEEAEFWDTHDSADFEDELVLRITGDDLAALVERAREVDTTPARLAYDWIQVRLGAASPASNHNAR